jgi:toxin YhaV
VTTLAVQINGWSLYAHPLFLDQLDALIGQVEAARRKGPAAYKKQARDEVARGSVESRV